MARRHETRRHRAYGNADQQIGKRLCQKRPVLLVERETFGWLRLGGKQRQGEAKHQTGKRSDCQEGTLKRYDGHRGT